MDGQQAQSLAWGIGFTCLMYIIGNGIWTNHLARRKMWMGWMMWTATALVLIVIGAFIDIRLAASQNNIWQQLTSVDKENHWIAFTLFALMSVPGAASVILKQAATWTRLALVIPAIVVFIPIGMQLGSGASSVAAGIGLCLVVSALMLLWQHLLDTPPEEGVRKTKTA